MPESNVGSSNFGNAKNVRLAAGWVFFQEHGKDAVIPLGYTQGGIQTEISSETEGVEADQSSSPIINTLSNVTCVVTTPLIEWTKENMLLAFPGAVTRQDAQNNTYVAMTSNVRKITGTLRIHPTDKDDNDHTHDTFYTNVSPAPNLSFTMDGAAAQQLPIEWQASPGNLPYAEENGDTAYFDHMPENAIVHVSSIDIEPSAPLTLSIGQTSQLSAKITPVYATDKKVTWESDHEDFVKVSSTGGLFAVATGTATITAKSRDGNKTDTLSVTVE